MTIFFWHTVDCSLKYVVFYSPLKYRLPQKRGSLNPPTHCIQTKVYHLIERLKISLRRKFKWFPSKIKFTLLEGHETCSREEARTEKTDFIQSCNYYDIQWLYLVLWKTWLKGLRYSPLREKERLLLSMSIKQPTMSPAFH